MSLFDLFSHHGHHHDGHTHVLAKSEAQDSDGDGFSDAYEYLHGTDPFNAFSHPILKGFRDSDGDGFPDILERHFGTDPHDPTSHPDAVLAHHYPAGSHINLPGTLDTEAGSSHAFGASLWNHGSGVDDLSHHAAVSAAYDHYQLPDASHSDLAHHDIREYDYASSADDAYHLPGDL